jgi:hypothetical protein
MPTAPQLVWGFFVIEDTVSIDCGLDGRPAHSRCIEMKQM